MVKEGEGNNNLCETDVKFIVSAFCIIQRLTLTRAVITSNKQDHLAKRNCGIN